jgi:hypothetical protein
MEFKTFYHIVATIVLIIILMILLYNNISYDIKLNELIYNQTKLNTPSDTENNTNTNANANITKN